MSDHNPYKQLGVTENSSFEEIQEAKQRLIQQNNQDKKAIETIEAAYDAIIMDRLRLRQEGKIKVPERIRFPEKTVEPPPSFPSVSTNNSPQWLQNLIDTPTTSDILWPTGVFLILALITVFSENGDGSFLSLLMAFAFAANVYFLNRKEQRFGKAMLLTLLGLLLGISTGNVIANLLISQNLGITLGVDQFATLFTFCLFWLISSFLR